jgi:hypothetical protein
MELQGKIIKVLPMQSGTGKTGSEWRKQEFVIETPGTYPKKVALTVWNERTMDLQSLALGQEIKAYIDIESREYNERWYTDIKAWKLEKVLTGAIENQDPSGNPSNPVQPFQDTPKQPANIPTLNPFESDDSMSLSATDDIPF